MSGATEPEVAGGPGTSGDGSGDGSSSATAAPVSGGPGSSGGESGSAVGGATAAPVGDGGFDSVPRRARWLVAAILGALLVPGIIGFEAWPLTGWRLFSLSRDDAQTAWVVEAVDAAGDARPVDVEELPLGYRHAEWPMAELPGASTERRQAVCEALLDAVADVEPGTVALNITRDRQRLVERGGEWTVTHDPETIHTCRVGEAEG